MNNKVYRLKHLFLVLLVCITLLSGQQLYAQSISGSTSVSYNSTQSYYIGGASSISWGVSGGYSNKTTSGRSMTLKWTAAGTHSIHANFLIGRKWYYRSLNVTVNRPPPPAAPGRPTGLRSSCGGSITLTRSGNPPFDVTWYWQGKIRNGVSTTKGSGITYVANEGTGIYYIRSQHISGVWGGQALISITVNSIPSTPVPRASTNTCGDKTVTVGVGPPASVGIYWCWQGTNATGKTTSNNTTNLTYYPVTSSGTYYIRAYNANTLCWGNPSSVDVTVNPIPLAPTISEVTQTLSSNCSTMTLAYTGGESILWSTDSRANSINVASDATYWLRRTSAGCHSPKLDILVTLPKRETLSGGGHFKYSFDGKLTLSGNSAVKRWEYQENGGSIQTISSIQSELRVRFENTGAVSKTREYWAVIGGASGCEITSIHQTITLTPLGDAVKFYCVGDVTDVSGLGTQDIGCGVTGTIEWLTSQGGRIEGKNVTWTSVGKFYMQRVFENCHGGRQIVPGRVVEVLNRPSPPTLSDVSFTANAVCSETILTYTGSSAIVWRDGSTGRTFTATSDGTYSLRQTNGWCSSLSLDIPVKGGTFSGGGLLSGGGSFTYHAETELILTANSGTIKEYRYKENGGPEIVVPEIS